MDSHALCTWAVMIVTVLTSVAVFYNRHLEPRFIFEPERILAGKEHYRLVTSGFLHADTWHLGVNMISLYFFGPEVELFLGKAGFLAVYFGAIIGGNLLSLYVHRNHEYRAYGASGGVCGVIFAHILLMPGVRVYMFPIPIGIPGWLYAVAFMAASFYGIKAAKDNIGHDAHLGGAILGLLIAAGLEPGIARQNWQLLALVVGVAALLLAYLWINPMLLPSSAFTGRPIFRNRPSKNPKREFDVDALLEKINKHGIDSLTPQEKDFLEHTSAASRRRVESKKPGSGLPI